MARRPDTTADVLVVGAGAAGLFASLTAATAGARVLLVAAVPLAESASYWAQGGLAAAIAVGDSVAEHVEDTVAAGRGLTRRSAAQVLCEEAPGRVAELEALGVRFDADRSGHLALGLEGGHGRRRVAHAGGSQTGRRILRQLSAVVAEHPQIEVLEGHRAAALWLDADGRCIGAVTDDGRTLGARGTVLASGGAAAMWSRTTNPPGSYGSGLLLAHDAGAALADLELVQFHPTAVTGVPGREGYLVTEAVRGEGATLHDPVTGERFVDELAPRDEVARAIHALLVRTGETAVRLDMRMVDPGRFPNVVRALREAGVDPMTQLVPVAPACHYVMGGIVCDLEARTGVASLFAVGEAACNGLHGANRLASNSLSECFVFGRRAALAAVGEPLPIPTADPPAPTAVPAPSRTTRTAMWRDAGLERDADGLATVRDDGHPLARLIARCALHREESRGAHRRRDFPATDPALDDHHTVVRPGEDPVYERWT